MLAPPDPGCAVSLRGALVAALRDLHEIGSRHAIIGGLAVSATTRLLPPDAWESGVVVDLLFASSGIEGEVADAAEPLVVLKDTVAPVATVGHLIALKPLSESGRPGTGVL